METIRLCDEHGYFTSDICSVCERDGEHVLDGERRRQLSTFLSGALRHFPSDVGLVLDSEGWTDFDELVATVQRQYEWADHNAVEGIIATDPNGRYEREEGRVRAAYGHSVDVSIDTTHGIAPDTLYHGTAPRNLDAIREEGLRSMDRPVHLSVSIEEARRVGHRYTSDPVVLAVAAADMENDEDTIAKRGNATYTVDDVPPRYLSVVEESS